MRSRVSRDHLPQDISCDRDWREWRVPRVGTKSRTIYEFMCLGKTVGFMALAVGSTENSVRVLMWKIRHPDNSNKRAREYYRRA